MEFSLPFVLLFSLYLLPYFVSSQNNSRVSVGTSLSASSSSTPWLSPFGDFAFGFKEVSEQQDHFLLCIWYDKIQERTVVWSANGDNPAPKDSKLELTSDKGLVLTSPTGQEIWTSQTIVGVVAYGIMNDTGNFMLQGDNSHTLWESFKNPTDTLLPSQTLERGTLLFSRRSQDSFAKGRFQLWLKTDGNLVLTTINLPTDNANDPYYESETVGSNLSSPGLRVMFNESGYLYILEERGQIFPLTDSSNGVEVPNSKTGFYLRATIEFDGVLVQYYYPKNESSNRGWKSFWSKPDNICMSSRADAGCGTCGYNSVCRLNGIRPICDCPRGYFLMNDLFRSCSPNYTIGCDVNEKIPAEDLYDFEELTNVDWPTSDYALLQPFTEDQCRQSCLEDCFCAVAIFRAGDMCWKKKLPLSNGRVDPNLNGKALIKIRKGKVSPQGPFQPASKNDDRETIIIAISVLLGSSVVVNFITITAICFGFFFIYQRNIKQSTPSHGDIETNLHCFTYKDLEQATGGFKEELGRGAFGIVFKGSLKRGSQVQLVAVKKLHSIVQDAFKEFKTEVNVIGQTHHKNLVKLVGFCDDGVHHMLVYEYMSNGALASFLFEDYKPSWNLRTQIIFGVARGLCYLHEECSTQIIHCDIKPQNILLDEYYKARISDFGLAKLLTLDQSQTLTSIRGTKGYVAPEWFRNFPVTVKVDVYSFGVLLLEIICCRKCVDAEKSRPEEAILSEWAYDCYMERAIEVLVANDKESLEDKAKLERLVMVALWCIQEDPNVRPSMRKVSQMLEGVVEVPVPPCPYPFSNVVTSV